MTLRHALPAALAVLLVPALAAAQPAPPAAPPAAVEAPPAASPTEALFNAINLGDLEQARAAIGAGADVNGRNVLGLTPLDLAIDLGQSEIAFYLMSLGRVSSRATAPAPTPAPTPVAPAPRGRPVAAGSAPGPTPTGTVPVAPLWQGGGGSPVPDAGFLGFDAGRPAGARPPGRPRG